MSVSSYVFPPATLENIHDVHIIFNLFSYKLLTGRKTEENGPKVQFTVLFTYSFFFYLSFISVVDNIIYVIFVVWWEGVLPNHKKKEMR